MGWHAGITMVIKTKQLLPCASAVACALLGKRLLQSDPQQLPSRLRSTARLWMDDAVSSATLSPLLQLQIASDPSADTQNNRQQRPRVPFLDLSTCDYSQVHSQWRRHEKGLKKVYPL